MPTVNKDGREFQAGEVVTLCDNLLFLLRCYPKGEILRKPLFITNQSPITVPKAIFPKSEIVSWMEENRGRDKEGGLIQREG
jgi:hypothetical protein